jgi:hypothetical protein
VNELMLPIDVYTKVMAAGSTTFKNKATFRYQVVSLA